MISPNPHVLVAPAKRREAGAVIVKRHAEAPVSSCEARIDEVVEQSFPASDPPSWNMGVADPDAWR